MQTISERLIINAKKNPGRIAVIFENEQIDYGTLSERALQCRRLFIEWGVEAGDRIIVQGIYSSWFVAAAFATHLCNAVFIPIDKSPSADTVIALADRVEAKLIVTDFKIEGVGYHCFDELDAALAYPADAADLTFPSLDSVADIMFTTGTTGTPKGVELTHRNLTTTAETRVHECGISPNNVGITLVPLNHVAPMRELYLSVYNGSSFIFLDGMTKIKIMFDYIELYRVTSMYIPPASISLVAGLSKDRLSRYADQMDYVYTGSAPMQVSQQEFMRKSLPKSRLFFSYGSSENGTVCLHRYYKDFKDITCCGKPCIGVELKIVNEDFEEVPHGELGMITIKSDMNMKGYFRMPELNAEVYRDGYFVSNDIGYIDDEGFLFVCGRKDDIINIGGLKVYPSEIEVAALKIEGICDCVCFSVSDAITGQASKLLIRVKDGFDKTIADVKRELEGLLDSYKVPKVIEFTEEIARTSNGKLDRKFYMNQK